MKAGVIAVAAALAGCVAARKGYARRYAHEVFHERGLYPTGVIGTGSPPEPTCGCTTIYTTITGEGTIIFPSSTYASNTTAVATSTVVRLPTTYPSPVVPTPLATVCPTPGVYTIPATTVTLTESTTVCGATSTEVPVGTHTAGGVTTVVEKETTVVCPYAAIETNSDVTTSVIKTTTYVCPSAGTYTIAPLTTTLTESTVWVYPTPASYAPGTYIQPEVVTTVTKTNYVVFCPFTSPAPVRPTSNYVAPPVEPTSTYVAPPIKPTSTYVTPPVVPTYAPAPVVSKPEPTIAVAPPKSTPTKSTGQLGSSGPQWAITYSPYQDNGQCKDASFVASDIAKIAKAGFSTVRVYSSDCSGLKNIGSACEAHGLKIILGIFISGTGISGAAEQVTDIIAWNKWSMVDLVVVGNEAIFSGSSSGVELAAFILSCKTAFKIAGYSGPVTTTETLDVWEKNAAILCPVVDVVGCNIHPFFNADVDAEHAGEFVASQLKIVDGLCPGKYGLNLETGWPSAGTCNGKACPGPSEQVTAIKGIEAAVGGKSVMFSMYNDLWKEPGAFGCEQSWGSIQIFGQ